MKAYYLSKVVKVNQPSIGDYWTHRLHQRFVLGADFQYVGGDEIAVDPNTGIPTQRAVLVLVDAIDHRLLRNDRDMVSMPDAGLDVGVRAIPAQARNAVKARIRGLGYTDAEIDAIWESELNMRGVLNGYGRANKPDFDVANFDVS